MQKLTDQVKQVLKREDVSCIEGIKRKKFIDAIELHNEIIKKGLSTPRGNRLMPIEKRMRTNIQFNSI